MVVFKNYYYTFTLHFFFLIGQHSSVSSQCPEAVTSFAPNIVNYSTELSKNKLLDGDDLTTSRPRKLRNSKNGLQQFGIQCLKHPIIIGQFSKYGSHSLVAHIGSVTKIRCLKLTLIGLIIVLEDLKRLKSHKISHKDVK